MTPDELKQIGNLFDQKTAEIRRHVDESIVETKRHFDEKTAETQKHFDEKAAETRRHFDVVGESLRADIRVVAEGHDMLNEKMDRMREESDERHCEVIDRLDHHDARFVSLEDKVGALDQKIEGIDGRLTGMEHELTEFRAETRSGFDEVRSAIRFSYAELDRRVSTLESELVSFATRLDRVEALVVR